VDRYRARRRTLGEMPGWSCILRAAVAVTAAATGLAACSSSEDETTEAPTLCPALAGDGGAPRQPALVVLDNAGRLTRYGVPDGRPGAVRRFADPHGPGPAGARLELMGRLLAPLPGDQGIVMLHRNAAPERDVVLMLEPRTLRPRCRFPLPKGIRYRAVATAQERVFAFGNRPAGDGRNSALFSLMEPDSGAWETHVVRHQGQDWFVQWGAASADGQGAILTYHGVDTTGADFVRLEGSDDGASGRPRYIGEVHGAAEPTGDAFIATNGSGLIRLDGPTTATEPLGVPAAGVHVMHFALNAAGSAAYVSSCGNTPSIHRLDLATRELRRTRTGDYCGEVLGVVGDRYAALGATRVGPAGFPTSPTYRLRLVDLEQGGAGVALGQGMVQAVLADPGSRAD
jgi:hypothetical protein